MKYAKVMSIYHLLWAGAQHFFYLFLYLRNNFILKKQLCIGLIADIWQYIQIIIILSLCRICCKVCPSAVGWWNVSKDRVSRFWSSKTQPSILWKDARTNGSWWRCDERTGCCQQSPILCRIHIHRETPRNTSSISPTAPTKRCMYVKIVIKLI